MKRFPLKNIRYQLAHELHKNKVVRTRHFHQNKSDVLDSINKKLRLDEETVDQLLFNTIYFLSGRAGDSNDEGTIKEHPWVEFNLPPEWDQAQEKLIVDKSRCVKFWCMFVVTRD